MIKKQPIITILAFLFLALAGAANTTLAQKKPPVKPKSKTAAPRTITDFYKILPAKYFPYFDRVKNRLDLIEGGSDKTGYLNFVGNRPGMPLHNEMILLKKMSGAFVLAIAYTDCFSVVDGCEAVLRFVEYENNRWTEIEAAPVFDLTEMRRIYRSKTGREAKANPYLEYRLSSDKTLTVVVGNGDEPDTEIYKLEWDGNIFDYVASGE